MALGTTPQRNDVLLAFIYIVPAERFEVLCVPSRCWRFGGSRAYRVITPSFDIELDRAMCVRFSLN